MAYFTRNFDTIINVIALLITLVGFAATLNNLRKSRKETEQILTRVSSQLLFNQITHSSSLLLELRQSARSNHWSRCVDRCEQLHTNLATLTASAALTDDEREIMSMAIDDLGYILRHFEILESGKPSKLPQTNETLDKLKTHLNKIDGRLRNLAMEMPND